MSTKPALLRAEPHATVGAVILRDAGVIIDRWAKRAAEEQPSARRVHHDVLLDHLPTFLWELGRSLADAGGKEPQRLARPANVHGDQRWEAGWSIDEVVRDYQLLRVVVTEYLDETIERPLSTREVLSLGVFIDDAIAASVSAYTANQNAAAGSAPAGSGAGDASGREDFFAVLGVLGHELRNPLAPLATTVQVLKASPGDKAAVERASAMMDRQVKVMTRLVDDLLDLPRLARAKMRLSPARLDLSELVRNAVEDAKPGYAAAGIALGLELPTVAVVTTGDAQRLSQVVGNLLTNGLKFTNRGGEVRVRLTVDLERRVAGLSVRDTGIGIERVASPESVRPVRPGRPLRRAEPRRPGAGAFARKGLGGAPRRHRLGGERRARKGRRVRTGAPAHRAAGGRTFDRGRDARGLAPRARHRGQPRLGRESQRVPRTLRARGRGGPLRPRRRRHGPRDRTGGGHLRHRAAGHERARGV